MSETARHLKNVSWKSEVLPIFKNCFGYFSRLSGHKRVPEPPARIMVFIISTPVDFYLPHLSMQDLR